MTNTPQLDRAIQIGHECLGIDAAIYQLGVAFGNDNRPRRSDIGSPLFSELSTYREALRKELLEIADNPLQSVQLKPSPLTYEDLKTINWAEIRHVPLADAPAPLPHPRHVQNELQEITRMWLQDMAGRHGTNSAISEGEFAKIVREFRNNGGPTVANLRTQWQKDLKAGTTHHKRHHTFRQWLDAREARAAALAREVEDDS